MMENESQRVDRVTPLSPDSRGLGCSYSITDGTSDCWKILLRFVSCGVLSFSEFSRLKEDKSRLSFKPFLTPSRPPTAKLHTLEFLPLLAHPLNHPFSPTLTWHKRNSLCYVQTMMMASGFKSFSSLLFPISWCLCAAAIYKWEEVLCVLMCMMELIHLFPFVFLRFHSLLLGTFIITNGN